MSSMPMRVASARPGSQNKQPSAVSAARSWLCQRIQEVMLSTAQPQSGLAMSIRCWSGFMKPREELHAFASSPRRITEDPGGSSPTFPTCWVGCRRVGRLCSSLTQGWCTSCRCASPHQTGREAETAPLQNSADAVLLGSLFWQRCFLDWLCFDYSSALGDGSYMVQSSVRARSSPTLSRTSRPRCGHGVYLSWLPGGLARHILRDVADASLWQGSWTTRCRVHSWTVLARTCLVAPSGREVIGASLLAQTPSTSSVPVCSCPVFLPGSCPASGSVRGALHVPPGPVSPGIRAAPLDGSSKLVADFPVPVSPGVRTGMPDVRPTLPCTGHGISHPTSTWCPSADGSCEILIERDSHGVDGQITNSLSLSNAPSFRDEGRWPWIRAPVAFVAGRKWQDERVTRVACV